MSRSLVNRLIASARHKSPFSVRSVSTNRRQNSLPAVYYRGGSSRAIFFNKNDLPNDESLWPSIFLGSIGSPDPNGRQLDGLGGGISSLSKVCVVAPSDNPDADVDYTFVSIGVKNDKVDYSSNCGNMSAAVGPFAVDSALVNCRGQTKDAITVRIQNTNTRKMIHATFTVIEGEAASSGNFSIDGVSGTAAPIKLDFIDPAGSRTGKLLPSGAVVDTFDGIPTTCIDAGNPCCFVKASDLGVRGNLTADEIEGDAALKKALESIRTQAAVKMGLAKDTKNVPGSVPKVAITAPAEPSSSSDINVRAMSVGQAHKAIPVTVAIAAAAAAKIPGSTVGSCFDGGKAGHGGLCIWHASGKLSVDSTFDASGKLLSGTVFRTARRLMEGRVFWK